jgi:TetR/AcrR family transcriptional repressor of nem operon
MRKLTDMARPRSFDDTEVTAAARDAFWSHGYAATSIDDLCEATGLGRGSLYGAFGDKRSLYLTALDAYVASVIAQNHRDLYDTEGKALQRLVFHIRRHMRLTLADTKRRGCLISKSAAELSSSDREVVQHTKRSLDTWRNDLAATLAEAQADGDLPADRDTDALASLLLTVLRGMESIRTQGASPAVINATGEAAIKLLLGTPG